MFSSSAVTKITSLTRGNPPAGAFDDSAMIPGDRHRPAG